MSWPWRRPRAFPVQIWFNAHALEAVEARARKEGLSPEAWCHGAVCNALADENYDTIRPPWIEAKFAKLEADRA